ncbi:MULTISPECIES: Gfo/Idh/MocA family protein [unclassified Nocardioides]|uniref:Gfo/Idh/MocA family protein n=1 Tax=unclassified Nocardioides TaxID=2615069 RepID=UPI0009F15E0D|nr:MULTISPECIES: Gfo/Idh/MocA family oxidoreductase [unclassified Nocardioides]GAW48555.1 oxidoreductase domain-containing protein [Nocardioides sp. PD653-B2]GAW52882.1 oxidoreductase domain-containing protein [Nocardioides sp. PD653]
MESIGWGILATGKIAHEFARDLALVPGARLAAVGSRRPESARAFADQHGAAAAYGSYAELVADPTVDVVYIATPHALHLDNARLCFEAGKHVLCEKPLALDTAAAAEMGRLAGEHDRFLMEAMWMACHPVIRELRERLGSGELGAPRQLHAELGSRVDAGPDDRMFDPALGASALLDIGIYPLTFAQLMLGPVERLTATADLSDRGIDLDIAIAGRYPGGALATMTASITSYSSRRAEIGTSTGRIDLDDFHHPAKAVFTPYAEGEGSWVVEPGEPVEILGAEPIIGQGYGNEIAEVGRCLREGLRESPLVPHEQTLALMRQMDELRAQVGVSFS